MDDGKAQELLEHVLADHRGIILWLGMSPVQRALVHHALHAEHGDSHFSHVHKMTVYVGKV